MRIWLAVMALVPLIAAPSARAQTVGLLLSPVPNPAHSRYDLRVSEQPPVAQPFMLSPGMIVRRDLATNAAVGVGLAPIRGRKKGLGGSGDAPVKARRPAVSFIMKF